MELVKRTAVVNELEPIKADSTFNKDVVDEALDKVTFTTKTLMTVFLFTMFIMIGIWATWNLKNALHIDLRRGRHHELIDEVNDVFGI